MQDTFNQFQIDVHAGKYNINHRPDEVEVEDLSAYDQCFDLAFAWCDVLGIPRSAIRHGYAHEIWDNATDETRKYFDLIRNNPNDTNHPVIGDIVVFKQISGIPVGHVSIESGKSDGYNAITFDQNWDTIHYYHTVNYIRVPYSRIVIHNNYYGVVGWLHPKNQSIILKGNIPKVDLKAIVDGPGSDGDKLNKIRTLLV